MKDTNDILDMSALRCYIVKEKIIREEIINYLEKFKLINFDQDYYFGLIDDNGTRINMYVYKTHIDLIKFNEFKTEQIRISNNYTVKQHILEKRKKGVIYTVINKKFNSPNKFENNKILTDVFENIYVFTSENLKKLMSCDVTFSIKDSTALLSNLNLLEKEEGINLKECSDYYSEFSTHINYYLPHGGLREVKVKPYSAMTYLNEEDISELYKNIDGDDKLYRIYDLYCGVINKRNEIDIELIILGELPIDAYNLKVSRGIIEHESKLVGKSSEDIMVKYYDYLKHLLNKKYGYSDEFENILEPKVLKKLLKSLKK